MMMYVSSCPQAFSDITLDLARPCGCWGAELNLHDGWADTDTDTDTDADGCVCNSPSQACPSPPPTNARPSSTASR